MEEKINIAELKINVDSLLKSASEVKQALDEARKAQQELTKAGDTSSKQFVQNASDIKSLSTAYNLQISAITKHTKAVVDQSARVDLLNAVLGTEVQTIEEARHQNKLLNQLRNQTNVTTAQGAEELKKLNEQLDSNNNFIKANADSYLQQKINIGNYRDDIKGAFSDLNIFNGGLANFIEKSNEAGGAGNVVKNGFSNITTGIVGMTKAGIAFIMTPIGATITALVVAVTLITSAFKRGTAEMGKTTEGTNKMNGALSKLNAIFSPLAKWMNKIAKEYIENLIEGFNELYEWVMKAVDAFGNLMKLIGFDEAGENIKGWVVSLKETEEANRQIIELQDEYNKKSREAKLIQLEYQRDAEKLRQIRDDESKSLTERLKANKNLGELLKKQMKEELDIQMINLRAIEAEIKLKGNLKDLEDKRIEALTAIADIQERITGQESEQKKNAVSLIKQSNDLAKQRADEAKQRAKEQATEATNRLNARLRIMVAEKALSDKGYADELATAESVYKKKLEIIDAEYKASDKKESDRLSRLASIAEAEVEIEKTRADFTIKIAESELERLLFLNRSRLDDSKALTEEMVENEKMSSIIREASEISFLKKSLENKLITQQEYEIQLNDISLKGQQDREALDEMFKAQKAEKEIIDVQNRLETLNGNFILEYELRAQQLEMQRQQEIEEAEKTGADVALINAKYNDLQKKNDELLNKNKLDLASSTFGNLATIFGEHSRMGKAMAVMQATIDTYQSAVSAYKSLSGIPVVGPALGAVAAGAAVATGLANVRKITSTKEPKFADGGIFEIGGRLHRDGGTTFRGSDGSRFQAERGEGIGILSRGAFSAFQTFNDRFRGGIDDVVNINRNNQSMEIVEAIKTMPAPVVFVEDIMTTQTSYVKAINYADL